MLALRPPCCVDRQLIHHIMSLLDRIEAEHLQVWSKTSALNSTCERLLAEQMALREKARPSPPCPLNACRVALREPAAS